MKKSSAYYVFLLVLFLVVSCSTSKKVSFTRPEVKPLSDTVRIREGSLVYALPMTVFNIRVEMQKTIELPGPYAKYARDLLGLNNVIMNRNERWSITGISVDSHQEADPSEYYVIEASGLFRTNALEMKEEGLILDLNPALDSQGTDHIKGKEQNINRFTTYDLGSDEYYSVQSDTAFRRVRVDSSFIRIPYIVEKKKLLTNDQLAEKAAKRLMDLRDGKILILTGEANVFPQSSAAIDEIDRMEQDYTQLFTGKTFNEALKLSYQFIPGKDTESKTVILFNFSAASGPSVSASASSTPFRVEIVPEQKIKDLTMITREQPETSIGRNDKLYYRIPDIVSLNITMGKETLYSSRRMVYQLGEILQLPSNYILGK
jgi:hypothetical protein